MQAVRQHRPEPGQRRQARLPQALVPVDGAGMGVGPPPTGPGVAIPVATGPGVAPAGVEIAVGTGVGVASTGAGVATGVPPPVSDTSST